MHTHSIKVNGAPWLTVNRKHSHFKCEYVWNKSPFPSSKLVSTFLSGCRGKMKGRKEKQEEGEEEEDKEEEELEKRRISYLCVWLGGKGGRGFCVEYIFSFL